VAIDTIGFNDEDRVSDLRRASLVLELVAAGYAGQVLLSSSTIGVAKGQPDRDLPLSYVLTSFVPLLAEHGMDGTTIQQILVGNPRELLAVRA
jgi:phosphotriesterase-related protein